jgi:hypothetical protein
MTTLPGRTGIGDLGLRFGEANSARTAIEAAEELGYTAV